MKKSINGADSVCVTGLGMVASLGWDAATVCAAARAGIVRSQAVDYFRVRSAEDGEPEDVVAHALGDLTRGFEGFARLVRIAQAGLCDLQRQVTRPPWPSSRTGWYMSLPDPRRTQGGLELIADSETREARLREAQEGEGELTADDIAVELLEKAAKLANWPSTVALDMVAGSGHAGVAECMCRAVADLEAGRAEAAIVGGVDSLLDQDTLEWLQNTGRLKCSANPVGVQPGEAGAFLVLEPGSVARSRRADVFAVVQGVYRGVEERTLLAGDLAQGLGLANVLSEAAEHAGSRETDRVWLVSDQNGEPYRAIEWGNAVVRLLARHPRFRNALLWYPAISLGDTAGASGAVSLCLTAAAFCGGYAPMGTAFIVSTGDDSQRAAAVLTAPEQ